jgi:RNA polymerase sigma factor (sigma-70 family)
MTYNSIKQLELFRSGDKEVMKEVYLSCKPKFEAFFIQELGSGQDVKDLYQDCFYILHKSVMSNRIQELSAEWSTLLISIGKNVVRNQNRKKKPLLVQEVPEIRDLHSPLQRLLQKDIKNQAENFLNKLSSACKEVLVAFYYKELSMQEISEQMGYANANVAKKKKSLCLKKLKEIANGKAE